MEIKSYKNNYQFDVVKCPFCDYVAYVRGITKTTPDPLRDLKRHITNQSKNEALTRFLNEKTETPHLQYFKEHTKDCTVVVLKLPKRSYDNDLKLI